MGERVYCVIGGAGIRKDQFIKVFLKTNPNSVYQKRIISTQLEREEPFYFVNENKFAIMQEEGAFCLHWIANGVYYGIPIEIRGHLNTGRDVVFKGSRKEIANYMDAFDNIVFLELRDNEGERRARIIDENGRTKRAAERLIARKLTEIPKDAVIHTICMAKGPKAAVDVLQKRLSGVDLADLSRLE